ncbi:MAG TPA: hypothetical protein VFO77_06630, partial [Actinoplanes sp.]|nr:hypothetical protein [Actinoplanes sp.]
LGRALDMSSGSGVDVTLRVTRMSGSWVQVTATRQLDGEPDLIRRAEFSLLERRWSLDVDASASTLSASALSLPVILTAGLLVSLLAGLLVLLRLNAHQGTAEQQPRRAGDPARSATNPAGTPPDNDVNTTPPPYNVSDPSGGSHADHDRDDTRPDHHDTDARPDHEDTDARPGPDDADTTTANRRRR